MTEKNQIPKLIHYCWFGNNEKPELVKKCIESWKKYLPDYEIREWNNEDLKDCRVQYVQEAIKEKKWAFVSDYFRLFALYNYGGVYFDSDNEVLKSFDEFLNLDFFTGYECSGGGVLPFTAVVGAKKENKIISDLLDEYDDLSFINQDGTLNTKTNTSRVSEYFERNFNLKPPYNGVKRVELKDKNILFPFEFFCPRYLGDGKYDISRKSYAIHHFASSWVDDVRNFWNLKLPFGLQIKFYICKEETRKTNVLPKNEIKILEFPKSKRRYFILTFYMRIKNEY